MNIQIFKGQERKKGVSLSGMRCDEFLDRINRIYRIIASALQKGESYAENSNASISNLL